MVVHTHGSRASNPLLHFYKTSALVCLNGRRPFRPCLQGLRDRRTLYHLSARPDTREIQDLAQIYWTCSLTCSLRAGQTPATFAWKVLLSVCTVREENFDSTPIKGEHTSGNLIKQIIKIGLEWTTFAGKAQAWRRQLSVPGRIQK